MKKIKCNECGALNSIDSNFCKNCGKEIIKPPLDNKIGLKNYIQAVVCLLISLTGFLVLYFCFFKMKDLINPSPTEFVHVIIDYAISLAAIASLLATSAIALIPYFLGRHRKIASLILLLVFISWIVATVFYCMNIDQSKTTFDLVVNIIISIVLYAIILIQLIYIPLTIIAKNQIIDSEDKFVKSILLITLGIFILYLVNYILNLNSIAGIVLLFVLFAFIIGYIIKGFIPLIKSIIKDFKIAIGGDEYAYDDEI